MPKRNPATAKLETAPPEERAAKLLVTLKKLSTQRDRDNFKRFAITAPKAFGVSMANMKPLAKRIGRDHDLAAALWKTGWYEARMLATLIDDPARVTPAQMDRWCRDFDNWAICDTACFWLFDRTPHAFAKIRQWSKEKGEFQKRAAFALLASVALHDKKADDDLFIECLPIIEKASDDDRNFVKKGVNWALRGVGRRAAVRPAAAALAEKLAASTNRAARWIGRDALADFKKKGPRPRPT